MIQNQDTYFSHQAKYVRPKKKIPIHVHTEIFYTSEVHLQYGF